MDGCEETDFFSSMRAALPEYVVNCFLAAGYDVPEVVASMNTSEEPGNSIDLIENYITARIQIVVFIPSLMLENLFVSRQGIELEFKTLFTSKSRRKLLISEFAENEK